MNYSKLTRTIAGTGIILIGILIFLGNVDILQLDTIFSTWWPTIVIAGGALLALNGSRNYLWATIIIAAGILWQLNALAITNLSIWQLFWPVIIIAVGISLLKSHTAAPVNAASNDTDSLTAILGGVETKNESKQYQGGKVTALLGGVVLDLRKAEIKKEAILNITAIMGGVELKVPEHWVIRTQIIPILGGVENKTLSHEKDGAPVLTIVGTLCMGGVEIKH